MRVESPGRLFPFGYTYGNDIGSCSVCPVFVFDFPCHSGCDGEEKATRRCFAAGKDVSG